LSELSQRLSVPTENLLTPDTVRRLCWDWQAPEDSDDTAAVVDEFLAEAGARPWQRELTVPVLTTALTSTPDEVPEDVPEEDAPED
jgi:ribonuclease D